MIDRDTARDIAKDFLERGNHEYSVSRIVDLFEIDTRRPRVYGVSIDDRCWIAYLNGPMTGYILKSSDILVISKDDGRVLYFGAAGDEG